jgi:hypothetical protein
VGTSDEAATREDVDEGKKWHALMGSGSRLLQDGGIELLLLEEEAGGLDIAAGSGGLRLDVLSLLDDGLEPSAEDSNLGVVQHGDRTGQRTSGGG